MSVRVSISDMGFTRALAVANHAEGLTTIVMSDKLAAVCELLVELHALARLYASECSECRGKGVVGISNYDGHGSDADDQPCEGCADIRAVIAKAVTP